jgi:hypothetical protein
VLHTWAQQPWGIPQEARCRALSAASPCRADQGTTWRTWRPSQVNRIGMHVHPLSWGVGGWISGEEGDREKGRYTVIHPAWHKFTPLSPPNPPHALGRFEFLAYLPQKTQGVVVQPIGSEGVVVVGTNAVRGFSRLDQAWVATLADKLEVSLEGFSPSGAGFAPPKK